MIHVNKKKLFLLNGLEIENPSHLSVHTINDKYSIIHAKESSIVMAVKELSSFLNLGKVEIIKN